MEAQQSKYEQLGVDPDKKRVREIFTNRIRNDYPGAFVNIVRDFLHPGEVYTQHMDGDGSKFVQRILVYRELDDPSVLGGIVDDALSMNLGDIAAAGFVDGPITVTDVININAHNIPKDILLEEIGTRFDVLLALYRKYGIDITFLGGETADLPDQVQSGVFDIAVHARAMETDIVTGNVQDKDMIWGFASYGQALWEDAYNYGIMSNGLTLARTMLMWDGYSRRHPDLIAMGGAYQGPYKVHDYATLMPQECIGRAIISPTRQWAILIKILMDHLHRTGQKHLLHGITLNTGGGATKIKHVGTHVTYCKTMLDPPPLFHILHEASGEIWRNMYRTFNCGIGIDVIGDPALGKALEHVAKQTNIALFTLGTCRVHAEGENRVILDTPFGTFDDY